MTGAVIVLAVLAAAAIAAVIILKTVKTGTEKTEETSSYSPEEIYRDSDAPYAVGTEEAFKAFCQSFADGIGSGLEITYYENTNSAKTGETAVAVIEKGREHYYRIYRTMYAVPEGSGGLYYIYEDAGDDGLVLRSEAIYSIHNRYMLAITVGNREKASEVFSGLSD